MGFLLNRDALWFFARSLWLASAQHMERTKDHGECGEVGVRCGSSTCQVHRGEENHKAIHTCRGKGGKGTLAGQPHAQPQTCFCGRKGGQIVLKWLVFYGRWAEHIRSLRKLPAFRFYESSLPTVYSFVVFLLLNEGMGINHL